MQLLMIASTNMYVISNIRDQMCNYDTFEDQNAIYAIRSRLIQREHIVVAI